MESEIVNIKILIKTNPSKRPVVVADNTEDESKTNKIFKNIKV